MGEMLQQTALKQSRERYLSCKLSPSHRSAGSATQSLTLPWCHAPACTCRCLDNKCYAERDNAYTGWSGQRRLTPWWLSTWHQNHIPCVTHFMVEIYLSKLELLYLQAGKQASAQGSWSSLCSLTLHIKRYCAAPVRNKHLIHVYFHAHYPNRGLVHNRQHSGQQVAEV
jgi:hypothetical protein